MIPKITQDGPNFMERCWCSTCGNALPHPVAPGSKKPYSQAGKEVVKCGYEKIKGTQAVPERLDG